MRSKQAAEVDEELGEIHSVPVSPSTTSTKSSSPKPSKPNGSDVLKRAIGPGYGVPDFTGKEVGVNVGKGRKRTRKHKKHARKTKKHLRRK